jgi:hypothetical protein
LNGGEIQHREVTIPLAAVPCPNQMANEWMYVHEPSSQASFHTHTKKT